MNGANEGEGIITNTKGPSVRIARLPVFWLDVVRRCRSSVLGYPVKRRPLLGARPFLAETNPWARLQYDTLHIARNTAAKCFLDSSLPTNNSIISQGLL